MGISKIHVFYNFSRSACSVRFLFFLMTRMSTVRNLRASPPCIMHMMHTPARYHINHGALSRILIVMMVVMTVVAERFGLGMMVAGDIALAVVVIFHVIWMFHIRMLDVTGCLSCIDAPLNVFEGVA